MQGPCVNSSFWVSHICFVYYDKISYPSWAIMNHATACAGLFPHETWPNSTFIYFSTFITVRKIKILQTIKNESTVGYMMDSSVMEWNIWSLEKNSYTTNLYNTFFFLWKQQRNSIGQPLGWTNLPLFDGKNDIYLEGK